MNVSSVKNLNGEVFSAVQDASLTNVVQSNSAQWSEGVSIPVSNSGNLYKVEFDGIDLYGYKSSTTIDSEPVYSSLSSEESPGIQNTVTPSWNNNAFGYFNWVGFDVISISSNGSEIYPSDYENDRLTALNVYYKADWLYNNNNQPLPPFSGYIGKITLDNLFISSYIDKPSYFNDIKRCDEFRLWFSGNYRPGNIQSKYICSIGTYVQSEPRTFEGIFVIPQSALPTYEYDNTNKISAINGSALAGGGEVPSGTMNVTGLEYNAVNEISAYNGSAIAQYGAEKQWLVHDDTLVHLSNSAQYALGCNISALQRLMGIDETVLFSSDGTPLTAFTVSEPLTNFNEVVFYVAPNTSLPAAKVSMPMVGYNTSNLALTYNSIWDGFRGGIQFSMEYSNNNMSAFTYKSGYWFGWAGTAANTGNYTNASLYKIIGIGRKA